MNDNDKVIIKIDGDNSGFEKSMDDATKIAKAGLAAVSAAAAAAAVAVYKFGSAYETSLAKVATIADTSRVSISQLSAGILELSNKTGAAAEELNEALYQSISAGVDTANAVAFTEQAAKLAAGGFTNAASAVDIMTTVLNSYGMEASEAARVSDTLIQIQNKGKTTVDELASSMGKVIPTANAYGVSLDNLAAGYAIMTSRGIATAETTTYINSMLNELGKSGTDASDALKSLTGSTFKQLMESGASLGDVLAILQDAADASGLSLADMFGSAEAGKAALTLLDDGADGFNASMAQMQDSAGLTETAFETMSNTAEHSAQVISNKFKNLAIGIYDDNKGSIDTLMGKVADLADSFIDAAENAAPKLVSAVSWVVDNLDALATAAEIALSALVAYKAAMATQAAFTTVAKAVKAAAGAYDVLSAKVVVATIKQLAYNAAKKASLGLFGLLAAAVVAAAVALVKWSNNADTAANRTKAVKERVDELNESYEQAAKSAEESAGAEEAKIKTADGLISRIKELDSQMRSGKLTTDEYNAAAAELKIVVGDLNGIMPDLKLGIDEETGALSGQIEKVDELYTAYKELYLLQTKQKMYQSKLDAAAERLLGAQEEYAKYSDAPYSSVIQRYNRLSKDKDRFMAMYEAGSYTEDGQYTLNYSAYGQALAIQKTMAEIAPAATAAFAVKQAQEDYDTLYNELYGSGGIASKIAEATVKTAEDTGEKVEETANNTANNTVEAVKKGSEEAVKAYQSAQKDIKYQLDMGEISEAQYYEKLGNLRDEYLDESNDEWRSANVAIKQYHDDVAESAKDAAEKAQKATQKAAEEAQKTAEETAEAFNDAVSSVAESVIGKYAACIEALQQKQQSFADKLLGTTTLFEKKTKTYSIGKGPDVTVEYTALGNLDEQTAALEEYADALEAVKERGELPEGFFDTLRGLSVEDGLAFAQALLRASDEEFAAYLDSWQKQQDAASRIASELYSDEANELKTAFESEFESVPEDFFGFGENSAQQYGEGFLAHLPTIMEGIRSEIAASLASILPAGIGVAAPGGGSTNYYTTYNVQPSSGESTQAQLLAIRNAEALNAQRGV